MNFADIEKTWQSAYNRPAAAQLEKQKMEFIDELHRRRRAARGLLWLTAIPLILFTGRVILHLLWPDPALDRIDLAREWAIVPFFLLPWIGWLLFVRLYRRHQARHGDCERSINASVRALLDENRVERIRVKAVTALLLLSAGLVPVIVHQLRAVGKAGDEILLPAYVVWPAYVTLMAAGLVYRYRAKLLPRQRELASLLAQYEARPE